MDEQVRKETAATPAEKAADAKQRETKPAGRAGERRQTLFGMLMMAVSSTCYGISPMLLRFMYAYEINSNSLLMFRTSFACLILLIPIAWRRESLLIGARDLRRIALLSVISTVSLLALIEAYAHLDMGIVMSVNFTYPLFVSVIGAVFFGIALTRTRLVSIFLALGGVVLLSVSGSRAEGGALGIVLSLFSGVTYAVYMVMIDRSDLGHLSGNVLSFYLNLGTALCSLVFSLVFRPLTMMRGPEVIALMVGMALINSIVALQTFRAGISILGAARASLLTTLEPVISVITGVAVFGESLTLLKVLGIALILFSLFAANWHLVRRTG